jgi:hypothetical protein
MHFVQKLLLLKINNNKIKFIKMDKDNDLGFRISLDEKFSINKMYFIFILFSIIYLCEYSSKNVH